MLSTMKTMLFVSLALASNASVSFRVPSLDEEDAAEVDRIRNSPHLRQLIGIDPNDPNCKFGITNIESVPFNSDSPEQQRLKQVEQAAYSDGYELTNQYTVSAKTHGEGWRMTLQGYVMRDFTVYVAESKANPMRDPTWCGPTISALIFQDYYVEDEFYYGYCDGEGHDLPLGTGGMPPAYLRGELEAPEGAKNISVYRIRPEPKQIRVYTPEQQARLSVDQYGRRKVFVTVKEDFAAEGTGKDFHDVDYRGLYMPDLHDYSLKTDMTGVIVDEEDDGGIVVDVDDLDARIDIRKEDINKITIHKTPADCNGVKPSFPPMGPGPVIIDGNNTKAASNSSPRKSAGQR